MLQRTLLIAVTLCVTTSLQAAAPKSIAPADIAHPFALYLAQLSNDGKQRVSYKATAIGTYFYFEESLGVSVYAYDGTRYKKVEFMKGATLAKAIKKYGKK